MDFGATSGYTAPWKIGTGLPSSSACDAEGEVGTVYFRGDPEAEDASLYVCSNTAASTYAWELVAATEAGSGSGTPAGSGSELQYRVDGSTFGAVSLTSVSGSTVSTTGKFDFGGGTLEAPNGTSLPGTCVVGELFLKTDAGDGANTYVCKTTNTWVLQVGAGTPGGSTTQIQYNNSGAFGGISGLTWDGTTLNASGIKFELPNGTTLTSGDCDAAGEAGRVFVKTDATSGQQVYICEGVNGWKLQGDGGSGGGGAPTSAYYWVKQLDGTLTNEQVVSAGDGISLSYSTNSVTVSVDGTYVATVGGDNVFSGNNTLNLGSSYQSVAITNDTVTGTTVNYAAKLTGNKAIVAGITDTAGIIGIVVSGAGLSGTAVIAQSGRVDCQFDGPITAGHWVKLSTSTGGMCTSAGAGPSKPTGVFVIGRSLETQGTAGSWEVLLAGGDIL
ncbi:MAG: hypothetical protein A2Z18_03400 [Armatimonadetes bacterium RBG_16_58_9]|nr:MAG: hypothetical protein A2Z18_03400 [Armatimonadetes bacterium RBG_16_58_9]